MSIENELLKAELMASAPEYVHVWLKARADSPAQPESVAELELALLTRSSNLIDLGVARYGSSDVAVRRLFQAAPATDHGRVVRLAALSNRVLARSAGFVEPMPHLLLTERCPGNYPNEDELRKFFHSAPRDEVVALLQNPTVDEHLLTNLFLKDGMFIDFDDELWMKILGATIGNPRLTAEYSGPMDGYAEYSHNKVFDAAWALTGKVPTTEIWAMLLSHVLESVKPHSFSMKDIMKVIARWRIEPKKEKRDSSDLFLDPFLHLRFLLTQLISKTTLAELGRHEDIAIRCGVYRRCSMTTEVMRKAFSAEPQFFLDHAVDNELVWRNAETRALLRELSWEEKKMDMWYPNLYQGRETYFRREHPDWFTEEPRAPIKMETSLTEVSNSVQTVQAMLTSSNQSLARLTVMIFVMLLLAAVLLFRR
jgi:hypothetical protein